MINGPRDIKALTHNSSPLIPALTTMAALLLMILMSGCASSNWDDGDPYKYTPQTGYPYIGGPFGQQALH